ncbi:MAG: DUF3349 domain-containing protein [Mycobacterium sp.]
MGLADRVSSITAFFRVGYAKGSPTTGYVPLLALLRRRVTDDEIAAIASNLIAPGRRLTADIGVEITRITDELPSLDDLTRVQERLAAIRRPGGTSEQQPQ